MKNSSRLFEAMLRNFTRAGNGTLGAWASASKRRLNSIQLNSRLNRRTGSGGTAMGGTFTVPGVVDGAIGSAGAIAASRAISGVMAAPSQGGLAYTGYRLRVRGRLHAEFTSQPRGGMRASIYMNPATPAGPVS